MQLGDLSAGKLLLPRLRWTTGRPESSCSSVCLMFAGPTSRLNLPPLLMSSGGRQRGWVRSGRASPGTPQALQELIQTVELEFSHWLIPDVLSEPGLVQVWHAAKPPASFYFLIQIQSSVFRFTTKTYVHFSLKHVLLMDYFDMYVFSKWELCRVLHRCY